MHSSPLTWLPSSQDSPSSTIPLPQPSSWHRSSTVASDQSTPSSQRLVRPLERPPARGRSAGSSHRKLPLRSRLGKRRCSARYHRHRLRSRLVPRRCRCAGWSHRIRRRAHSLVHASVWTSPPSSQASAVQIVLGFVDVDARHAVAARRDLTVVEAGVVVRLIAVIARFVALRIWREVDAHKPVATSRRSRRWCRRSSLNWLPSSQAS